MSKFKNGDEVWIKCKIEELNADDDRLPHRIMFFPGKDWEDDGFWTTEEALENAVSIVPQSNVICDPTDPRLKDLIGQEVYSSDNFRGLNGVPHTLVEVWNGSDHPFRTSNGAWRMIKLIEKPSIKKMTVAEVAAALGYEVEIVKG